MSRTKSEVMMGNCRRKGTPTRAIFNRPEKKPRVPLPGLTFNQAAVRWRSNTFQAIKRMIEEENWPKHEGVAVVSIEIMMQRFHPIMRSHATSVLGALQKGRRLESLGYNERLGATLYVVTPDGRAYYEKIEEVMRTNPPAVAPRPSVQSKTRRLKQVMNQERWVKLESERDKKALHEKEPQDDYGNSLWMQSHRPVSMPSSVRLRDHELRNNLPWLRSRIEWQRSTHREPDSDTAWNTVSRILALRVEDLKKVWKGGAR